MSEIYRIVPDPFHVQLGLKQSTLGRLFGINSLNGAKDCFPAEAELSFGSRNKKERVGDAASIAGLMYLLCVRGKFLDLIKGYDPAGSYGVLSVSDPRGAGFEIYIPSVALKPSNEIDDCDVSRDGRVRVRRPRFSDVNQHVLFTVPENYEAAGETFCTNRLLEEAARLGAKDLVFISCESGREVRI